VIELLYRLFCADAAEAGPRVEALRSADDGRPRSL
jgi:hypothetical protein